jgi:hypothetical protein
MAFSGYTNGYQMRMGCNITGASTITPTDPTTLVHEDISNSSATQLTHSFQLPITGLTAGTNTFTVQYKVNAGTGYFNTRMLSVKGVS